MQRRDFIRFIAGSATAWPLAARAQQPTMPVIGFVHLTSLETNRENLADFRLGLKDTGYNENKNVTIEYRWAQGRNDQLATLVDELVRRPVSVIVALESTNSALAAKAATQTIPVVFMQSADPIRIGLVKSLNRPGGNLTGINLLLAETAGKRLELLLELMPAAKTVAHLGNPSNPVYAEADASEAQVAARAHGVRLLIVNASRPITLGGLMSYGTDFPQAWRQAGVYTGRILKGEKPADLPVQQVTKMELIINLRTAKTLGLNVPNALIGRADKVIE
jgi:putative ABC transport system substrate-binding protein